MTNIKKERQRKIGVSLSMITMFVSIIIGFFYNPFLLSKLGSNEYGLYSLAISLSTFVLMLDLGFGQASVRYISKYVSINDKHGENVISTFFIKLYCLIALLALIVGILIANVYPSLCETTLSIDDINKFKIIFYIMMFDIILSFPLSVFNSIMTAHEQFFILRMFNLLSTILTHACNTIILLLGFKSIGIAAVTISISVLYKIVLTIICYKRIGFSFISEKIDKKIIFEILSFTTFIFINIVVDYLYNNTDKLMLGSLVGTLGVTIYTIGTTFSSYFQSFSLAISSVFLPRVSYLYDKEKNMKEISNLFNKVGRIQMLLLFLVIGGFVVFGKPFISFWVGKEYLESYYVALLIMCPAIVPLTQNIGITILRVVNKQKARSIMYLVIAVLNVILSYFFILKFNAAGAALGTAVANILGQIIFMNIYYSKVIKIDIAKYWRSFLKFFVISAILVFTFSFCSIVHVYELVIYILLYVVAYCLLYFVFIANDYEKQLLLFWRRK